MGAPPFRVLLVDDNDLDALKIARATAAMPTPHVLVRARDGLEALAHLRNDEAVSLILLDLKMPRMDGFEFLAARESDPALSRIPLFVLSTSARQSDIDRCHAYRIAGYLLKPPTVPAMLDTVTAALRLAELCRTPRGESAARAAVYELT